MSLRPLRIGLDARPLQTGIGLVGIRVYTRHLIDALVGLDTPHQFVWLTLGNYPPAPDRALRRGTPLPVWRPRRPERLHPLWDRGFLPARLRQARLDLFHATTPLLGRLSRRPWVVTVYDLIGLRYPRVYLRQPDVRWLYQARLRSLTQADAIIAISEATKRDLVELLGLPAERITAVPLGVTPEFSPEPEARLDDARVLARYGIARPYILNVGGFDWRKNLGRLVEAYQRLPMVAEYQLVLPGVPTGPVAERIRACPELAGAIVLPGVVPPQDLPALYRQAALFVYPSLYEGFGLPPLEAMACGAPVICSDRSSLLEVVGAAGLLVDPRRVDELAAQMARVLGGPALRQELARRSVERARAFTWRRTAEQTLAVYERAVEGRGRAWP